MIVINIFFSQAFTFKKQNNDAICKRNMKKIELTKERKTDIKIFLIYLIEMALEILLQRSLKLLLESQSLNQQVKKKETHSTVNSGNTDKFFL